MKPQCAALLDTLRTRGSITDLEALELLGIRRLAARVSDLRAEGYDVRTSLVTTASGKRIGVYRLAERPVPLSGVQETWL